MCVCVGGGRGEGGGSYCAVTVAVTAVTLNAVTVTAAVPAAAFVCLQRFFMKRRANVFLIVTFAPSTNILTEKIIAGL